MRQSVEGEEAKGGGGEEWVEVKKKKWWSAGRMKKLASTWRKWFQSLDTRFLEFLNKYFLYPLVSAAEAVVLVAKLCFFYVTYGCRL